MIKSSVLRANRYYQKHGFKEFLGAIKDHFCREVTRLPPQYYIYSLYWRMRHGWGKSILDYDWDHIIILDACRLDVFQDRSDNSVGVRTTLGSNTTEFLRNTFSERNYHDIVYVSSNPKVIKLENDYREETLFHDLKWIRDIDKSTGAVPPETVADAARDAATKYPNKRLIVHINKPHTPWIGPTAQNLRSKHKKIGFDAITELIDSDKVSVEEMEQMYNESFDATLPVVNDLVEDLDGKVAVTADHGEFLYDQLLPKGRYWVNHPKRLRCSTLCRVPYIEYESSHRRTIHKDPPVERVHDPGQIKEEVEQRLIDLGYK